MSFPFIYTKKEKLLICWGIETVITFRYGDIIPDLIYIVQKLSDFKDDKILNEQQEKVRVMLSKQIILLKPSIN